jgi:hypothetical protein
MFASRTKKTVTLKDGAEDVQVTLRKLSGNSLKKLRDAKQSEAIGVSRAVGGEILAALKSIPDDAEAKAKKAAKEGTREAVYELYDRHATLVAGIESWTSNRALLTKEGIEDLEEPDAEFLFHEIIDLSDPAPEAAEATGKVA